MPSVAPTPTTTLTDNLRRLSLTHTADDLNDLVARATQKRWSPVVLLETLVQAELEDRTRRRVERRLRDACLGRFKSMTDWDWAWPKQLHRPTLERVFTLDFLGKGENVILVGAQGLGKTMLAKNLVHQAVLAGYSARFLTAADLVLDLNGQDTSRALERRLRAYARPHLLAIDEIGYLAYDAHAADLLFQIVSRRYEQRSLVVTTNLPFKQERLRRTQQVVGRESEHAKAETLQTAISFGATLLGAFLGRKAVSASTLGRATTAACGVGRTLKESQDIGRAKETVEAVQQQLQQLDDELRAETAAIEARFNAASEPLEKLTCKPKKTNIAVRLAALVWAPYAANSDGSTVPAW